MKKTTLILSIILGILIFGLVNKQEPVEVPVEVSVELGAQEERINGIIKRANPYEGRDIKNHIKQSILNGERPNPVVETNNWQDVVNSYSELLDEYDFDQNILENDIYLEIRRKAKSRGETVLPIKYER